MKYRWCIILYKFRSRSNRKLGESLKGTPNRPYTFVVRVTGVPTYLFKIRMIEYNRETQVLAY